MFSSFRLRSFLMAFTSAFLAFLLFWMAVLMLAHPSATLSNVQPSADSQDSFYLPGESDCMTLLLCEQRQDPQLFLLMRFQPVRGSIFHFAFPRQMLRRNWTAFGSLSAASLPPTASRGCAPPSNRASPSPATAT